MTTIKELNEELEELNKKYVVGFETNNKEDDKRLLELLKMIMGRELKKKR